MPEPRAGPLHPNLLARRVFLAAAMGWLFDTMDQQLFTLTRNSTIPALLFPGRDPATLDAAQKIVAVHAASSATALFLVGWAIGGILFGALGDRFGRARTMALTILFYSAFTGLSGLSQSFEQFCVLRFLAALGVGGEWAAGAALVAETFQGSARTRALGGLQAASGAGNMMAGVIALVIPTLLHARAGDSWRWIYAAGALPALLVFWIRRNVPESERWTSARSAGERMGRISELFSDPALRRATLAGLLLALAGIGGFWGVATWSPELTNAVLAPRHLAPAAAAQARALVFLAQMAGAIVGALVTSRLAERVNRRRLLAVAFLAAFAAVEGMFTFADSFASLLFWAPLMGFATLAPFAAFTIYFPELFPTRLRATGSGFCYNGARFAAAGAPFLLGSLAVFFERHHPGGGFRLAAQSVALVYALAIPGLLAAPETAAPVKT